MALAACDEKLSQELVDVVTRLLATRDIHDFLSLISSGTLLLSKFDQIIRDKKNSFGLHLNKNLLFSVYQFLPYNSGLVAHRVCKSWDQCLSDSSICLLLFKRHFRLKHVQMWKPTLLCNSLNLQALSEEKLEYWNQDYTDGHEYSPGRDKFRWIYNPKINSSTLTKIDEEPIFLQKKDKIFCCRLRKDIDKKYFYLCLIKHETNELVYESEKKLGDVIGLALAADAKLMFLRMRNEEIQVVTFDGCVKRWDLQTVGERKRDYGDYSGNIYFNQGELFVVNRLIQVYSPTGVMIREFGAGFLCCPCDIVCDQSNRFLFVTDTPSIKILHRNGTYLREVSHELCKQLGSLVCVGKYIFATDVTRKGIHCFERV